VKCCQQCLCHVCKREDNTELMQLSMHVEVNATSILVVLLQTLLQAPAELRLSRKRTLPYKPADIQQADLSPDPDHPTVCGLQPTSDLHHKIPAPTDMPLKRAYAQKTQLRKEHSCT
jgi:hypothetical protein